MKKIAAIIGTLAALAISAAPAFASTAVVWNINSGLPRDTYTGDTLNDYSSGTLYFTCSLPATYGGYYHSDLSFNGAQNIDFVETSNGSNIYSLQVSDPPAGVRVYDGSTPECGDTIAASTDLSALESYLAPHSGGGSTGSAITMPTSTASSLTATIGHQLTDPGTLLVIGLVAGIPLTFYVMEQLIALLPGNSKNRRK